MDRDRPIKVLIADDHAVVRRGLVQILEEAPGLLPIGEASTGREVLQAVRTQKIDVLVLDIGMPEGSGLDVLWELRSINPDLPVLVLSVHPEKQYAVRVLQAGAAGYLTKDSAPDDLVTAILTIADNQRYITPTLAQRLAGTLEAATPIPSHGSLSDREYQIMCLLAAGQLPSEIAKDLSLSVKLTVRSPTRPIGIAIDCLGARP